MLHPKSSGKLIFIRNKQWKIIKGQIPYKITVRKKRSRIILHRQKRTKTRSQN